MEAIEGSKISLDACRVELLRAPEGSLKVQRFSMLAHTGVPVSRGFFGSMVFDLAGIEAGAKVPILMNHDDNQIVGFADTSKVTEDGLVLEGVILTEEEAGARVQRLSKSGFPFQASIGVQPIKTEDLDAGSKIELNGQEVSGPATIVRRARLLESSFLPAGADGNTSAVALAAKGYRMADKEGDEKGEEGQGTGSEARALIKKAEDAGFSLKDIAAATDRTDGIISSIKSGKIKNPPTDFRDKLKRLIAQGKKKDEDMRAELTEFLAAFPGREGWAAHQFAAEKTLTEAKAELSDVLLAELATAREQLAAAPTAVAADPAAQVALTATHPGVGFSGAARQEPGTPTKQDLSGLSLSERALAEWNGTGKESLALQREFFGQFRFYLAFLQQEAKKNGEVV